ncbi:hypothetical protein JAAARDRAFT_36213 [Jaapia argillacea MUCL 33604]|uniref:Peptidase A1 domain-containing protein n=1 Tax=Jaapia argillacea MUCL 33604 TaxID=933084 RepID=A0A067PPL3_9AGAM|nr:hypothetical protein JAAARDRAFT_36213 [Jaapia argillacea MUCL 33604]
MNAFKYTYLQHPHPYEGPPHLTRMIHLTTLLAFISLFDIVFAFSVPFTRDDSPSSTSVNFTNANGFTYLVTVYFNGQPIQVQLDTGSSDLWIDSTGMNLTPFTKTGLNGTMLYEDLSVAEGPILVGPVQFGGFEVDKQAFISAQGSNATDPSVNDLGIMGVAPTRGSVIAYTLQNTSFNGRTFLDNAFMMYPEEPNYITFLLSRDPVSGITSGGTFTIGEVATEFAAITKTPQRKVLSTSEIPRWATTMDGMIVNGKKYSGHSKFNSTFVGAGQTITVLDSGTSEALFPRFYADAIYKGLPGAVFNESQQAYNVPCDTKVNVSFVFGKDEYPVNPIDVFDVVDVSDSGELTCAGAFRVGDPGDLDSILGDTFLRNAYALFDFGRWATPGTNDPFMQLLSVTNQAEAWNDFDAANTVRLNSFKKQANGPSGGNTTNDAVSPSPATSDGSNPDLLRNSYIIIGLLAGVIVLLLVLFVQFARGSKNVGYKPGPNVSRAGAARFDDGYDVKPYQYSGP